MESIRERWTDRQLDGLDGRVERGFAESAQRLDRVEAKVDRIDSRLDAETGRLDSRLDGVTRALALLAITMSSATVGGFLTLIGLTAAS